MKVALVILGVCLLVFIWYPKPAVDYNCGIKIPELRK